MIFKVFYLKCVGEALRKSMYSKAIVILTIGLSALVVQGCQTTSTGPITKKDPEKAIKVRTQLAAEYIRVGDLDAAKRALDQALEHDSRDSAANMMMGVLLQQEGSKISLEKADSYFKRAISSDSKMHKRVIIMEHIYFFVSVIMTQSNS